MRFVLFFEVCCASILHRFVTSTLDNVSMHSEPIKARVPGVSVIRFNPQFDDLVWFVNFTVSHWEVLKARRFLLG
jgi:hypothetical protein